MSETSTSETKHRVRVNLYVDGLNRPVETLSLPVGEAYEAEIHSDDVRFEIVGVHGVSAETERSDGDSDE